MDSDKKFYVYLYLDPRPGKNFQPLYVGKGLIARRRAYFHWEKRERCNYLMRMALDKIEAAGLYPHIEILLKTDSEAEAYELECFVVSEYGRRIDGSGSLCNITTGGEGTAGLAWSDEKRAKIMAKMHTPEALESNRQRMLAVWNTPEKRVARTAAIKAGLTSPGMRAKLRAAISATRTTEVRARIGHGSRLRWQDPAYRERVMAARAVTMATPEFKAIRGAATAAGWKDPETRAKRTAGIKAANSRPESKANVARKSKAYYADPARRAEAGAFAAAYNTPEVKARKADEMRARWADPIWRSALLAKRAAVAASRNAELAPVPDDLPTIDVYAASQRLWEQPTI